MIDTKKAISSTIAQENCACCYEKHLPKIEKETNPHSNRTFYGLVGTTSSETQVLKSIVLCKLEI